MYVILTWSSKIKWTLQRITQHWCVDNITGLRRCAFVQYRVGANVAHYFPLDENHTDLHVLLVSFFWPSFSSRVQSVLLLSSLYCTFLAHSDLPWNQWQNSPHPPHLLSAFIRWILSPLSFGVDLSVLYPIIVVVWCINPSDMSSVVACDSDFVESLIFNKHPHRSDTILPSFLIFLKISSLY